MNVGLRTEPVRGRCPAPPRRLKNECPDGASGGV